MRSHNLTASSSSQGLRDRENRRRSTLASIASIPPTKTSSPSKTPSNTNSQESAKWRSMPKSGSHSPAACVAICVTTPTSSWSAKSATKKRPISPSKPLSPATWSFRRYIQTTLPAPSRDSSIWASSLSSSARRSNSPWLNDSFDASAPCANSPTSLRPKNSPKSASHASKSIASAVYSISHAAAKNAIIPDTKAERLSTK